MNVGNVVSVAPVDTGTKRFSSLFVVDIDRHV